MPVSLEGVPDGQDNTAVATICTPLIKETRIGNCRVRRAEIAGIGKVEKVSPKLEPLSFTNLRVLHETKINRILANLWSAKSLV